MSEIFIIIAWGCVITSLSLAWKDKQMKRYKYKQIFQNKVYDQIYFNFI